MYQEEEYNASTILRIALEDLAAIDMLLVLPPKDWSQILSMVDTSDDMLYGRKSNGT